MGFAPERIEAIVFDVIGTLVDEETAWARSARAVAEVAGLADAGPFGARWAELLEQRMDAVVSGDAPWRPHRQLVGEAARQAVRDVAARPGRGPSAKGSANGSGDGRELLDAVAEIAGAVDREYAAWPEVAAATAALRRTRVVAGVSNGDLDSLARVANASAISWDVVLSTGAVQTFKPDPAAYRYAIDTLGLDPALTLFVASHPWDLRAAAEHGFRTAYVARSGAERPSADDRFDLEVGDLSELVERLG